MHRGRSFKTAYAQGTCKERPSRCVAGLLFALFTSVVFGIAQRAQPKMMIRFGAFTFVSLVGATIAASCIMYFIKH
jgi:hypothetical protein